MSRGTSDPPADPDSAPPPSAERRGGFTIRRTLAWLLAVQGLAGALSLAAVYWHGLKTSTDGHLLAVAGRQIAVAREIPRWVHMVSIGQEADRAGLARLAAEMDAVSRVIRHGGRVLGGGLPALPPDLAPAMDAVMVAWRAVRPELQQVVALPRRSEVFSAAVKRAGRTLPAVETAARAFAGAALARVRRLRTETWGVLASSLLATIAALVLGIAFIQRRIVRPLRRLSTGAAALGAGDLSVRLPASGQTELDDLARDFNAMAARLQANHGDLDRERARLSTLLTTVPSALVAVDGGLRITFANAVFAGLAGKPVADLRGMLLMRCFPVPEVGKAALGVIAGGEPAGPLRVVLGDDGRTRILRCTAAPVADTRGRSALILAEDITREEQLRDRRHDLEGRLEEARRYQAVAQLAAGMAHEINTPSQFLGDNIAFLSRVMGPLADALERAGTLLAADGAEDARRAREALAEALRRARPSFVVEEIAGCLKQSAEGVQRIATIVANLMELVRPTQGEPEPVAVAEVVEAAVAETRGVWAGIATVETRVEAELPSVWGRRAELAQALEALITNAAQAVADAGDRARSGGRISVRARATEGGVRIEVTDDGCGIPEEVQPRVFEPFFTTRDVGAGTGHGLALVHAVVRRHGGTVRLSSREGAGTTFTVELPLENAASASQAAA